jgi:hypothetical protein
MDKTSSASSTAANYSPDDLLAGLGDMLSEKVTLLTGQNCVRGTVLGKVTIGAINGVAAAGNTGNGALAGVAIAAAGVPKVGIYRVVCVEAAANSGRFVVEDPDGVIIGQYVVAAAAFNNGIAFTIADGAADFLAGDSFLITIAAGSGKYLKSVAAAVDGSQTPIRILEQDCDATAADAEAMVYRRGTFNDSKLVLGAGHTVASISDSLRLQGIFLVHGQASL